QCALRCAAACGSEGKPDPSGLLLFRGRALRTALAFAAHEWPLCAWGRIRAHQGVGTGTHRRMRGMGTGTAAGMPAAVPNTADAELSRLDARRRRRRAR